MSAAPTVGRRTTAARQVRLAESIAAELRQQILDGSLAGGMLPKQDELIAKFGVSGPSMREALRILEAEGLITIRRGKVGGAEIHRPNGASAAYAIGLTLQGEFVTVRDLAATILVVEPSCAAIVAGRTGQGPVLKALEENLAQAELAKGNGSRFTEIARQFHEVIVDAVPNPALRVLSRSLEWIWSTQEELWAHDLESAGIYPHQSERSVVAAHRRIVQGIRDRDPAEVERVARKHLAAAQAPVIERLGDRTIDAVSSRAVESFRRVHSTHADDDA